MEIVSSCCFKPLVPIETEICSECYEHCDPVTIGEDLNGNMIIIEV